MEKQGQVRCGRLVHFRSKEENKKHPVIEGFLNINATSGASKWSGLSPMKLGPFVVEEELYPCDLYPDGLHPGFQKFGDKQRANCTNLENYWQGSKVYNIDLKNNEIGSSFFIRRSKMISDPQPHRRSIPKAKGFAVAAYFNGNIVEYVPSRVYYCKMYEQLARETKEYQELEKMIDQGKNLHVIGYDGYDIEITLENMRKAYLDDSKPFGHELVLCCMLKGINVWT